MMRKFDFIIVAVALAAALLIFLMPDASGDPVRVSVISNGKEFKSIQLSDDTQEFTVENEFGKNTVRITHDGAEVIWSDCASQTCVHTGKITHSGQVIACLPHSLLITLEGGNGPGDTDVIAG